MTTQNAFREPPVLPTVRRQQATLWQRYAAWCGVRSLVFQGLLAAWVFVLVTGSVLLGKLLASRPTVSAEAFADVAEVAIVWLVFWAVFALPLLIAAIATAKCGRP